jgi:hypothetical protein
MILKRACQIRIADQKKVSAAQNTAGRPRIYGTVYTFRSTAHRQTAWLFSQLPVVAIDRLIP